MAFYSLQSMLSECGGVENAFYVFWLAVYFSVTLVEVIFIEKA